MDGLMPEQRPTVLVYRSRILQRSETFIKLQAESLRRWRPILVGRSISDGLSLGTLQTRDVRLPRLKLPIPPLQNLFRRKRTLAKLPPYDKAVLMSAQVRKEAWFSELRSLKPKLLHVHFGTSAAEAWPLAIALGIPMTVTLHGYDAATYDSWWESGRGGKKHVNYPATLRAMSQRGIRFIAVSDAIAEDARHLGIAADLIKKIHMGVRIRTSNYQRPIAERPRRILFVGRFVEKKGLDYLLRAFAQVHKMGLGAELRIIGDGPLAHQMKELVAELDIPAQFTGWKSADAVLDEMSNARVLCVPSVRALNGDGEGLPTVIPEAQAIGLPVVTSARGGATEGIINGVTGISVPERDVSSLVGALVRMLIDDEFASSAASEARRFASERFDIMHHVAELELFYDQLASNVDTESAGADAYLRSGKPEGHRLLGSTVPRALSRL